MRTIIAGSRTETGYNDLLRAIDSVDWKPTVVLSGGALGADRLGERWARANGVTLEKYPVSRADWEELGKRAGYVRNEKMAQNAEALIALWDGESKGTNHMIDIASKEGLVVFVWRTD